MVVIANFRESQYPEVSGTRCIKVYVPDDDAFLGLLAGLLGLPGSETNYQQEDIDKASALAQQWRDAYVLTDWGQCDVGAIVGEIRIMANATLPDGWLYCNGDDLLKTDYPELFDAITTFWGTPSDPLYFRLPDLRNRFPIGYAQGGGSPAFASLGGEATHTLTTAEIPAHTHPSAANASGSGGFFTVASPYQGTVAAAGWNTLPNTGGGGAHNNMPPYAAISFIIYAGV